MRHDVRTRTNALAEGQARRAVEEAPWVVRENKRQAFTDELFWGERCCLARMR
jgi:hypothetical protein